MRLRAWLGNELLPTESDTIRQNSTVLVMLKADAAGH